MTDINQGQVQRQSSQKQANNHPAGRHPEQIQHQMMHQQQQQMQHIQRIPMQEAMFYASQNYNRNHFIYKNTNRAPSSSHRPANWACWPESYNTSNRNKKKYEAVEKMASYVETDYNPIKNSNLDYFCKKYQLCLEAHNRNPINRMAPLLKKFKEPDC